ncbi:MAG: DUF1553 domain-containing protein [Planctomycetota bacterium]
MNNSTRQLLSSVFVPLVFVSVTSGTGVGQTIDFNRDVRPILSNRCLACHGPDKAHREGGLRLDDASIATVPLASGATAVVPQHPESSELMSRITSSDDSVRMPPPKFGKPLTDKEVDTLRRWIEQGAVFAEHWSYVKPVRPEVPAADASHVHWPRNAVDHFALHQMMAMGLKPSEPADPAALVRRVFLDLIGVPPAVDEADGWIRRLSDGDSASREAAYSQLVDHLLSRPEFGEHWARKWLDLARYADSSGYADDPARVIWPWRDWVIRAINSDMPFDQFTIEQLAGDLLTDPGEDQLIATAFHRNTMTNNEGGTQDEEFRNVAVVDRVNTTMAVWMGTTIACSQCHDHKYDPLSQEEYFRLFAILNNTEDADRGDDSPRLPLFTAAQKDRKTVMESRLAALDGIFATSSDALAESQKQWEARLRNQTEWIIVKPESMTRASGSEVQIGDDGTIFVPTATDKDTYTIDVPLHSSLVGSGLAAFQIQVMPHEHLPGKGSGHGGGNFVLSEVRSQIVPRQATIAEGQFVRIELAGEQKILSLAEVQIFANGMNIATQGKATQSSTDFAGPPELAIDGKTDGNYENQSVTHTAQSAHPWWEVDLGKMSVVESITLWNRTGAGVHERLAGCRVTLLNSAREEIWSTQIKDAPNPQVQLFPASIRDLPVSAALADFSQDGFAPSEVLDGKTEPENGWAVGGHHLEPHALTLVPAKPLKADDGAILRLTLEQNSPYANHLLGNFRVAFTSEAAIIERSALPKQIAVLLDKPSEQRSSEESARLALYYRENIAPDLADARSERQSLRQELAAMKPDTSVPILRELRAEQRRKTQLQYRGNYLDKGPEVHPAVPAVFPQIVSDGPVDRLAFARWLVSEENPLTARVIANRYWETLFGRGIVGTSEEFGSQGDLPTHPDLLDWLATELIQSRWNTKSLLRTIVMSSTYRQSSFVSTQSAAADPENRWLARGPRVRLTAEMVRDQSLQVAGLLSNRMYGPPVKPPQPSLGLSAAFGSSTDWQTSSGEDRYRRAIYTTWRRSNPYPSMATFDAPNREVCTLKRNRTNTPLQALVTMNDPVYVEAAQSLGRLMLRQDGGLEQQIRYGFHRCTLRQPTSEELTSLVGLYQDVRAEMDKSPEDATRLATDPLGPLPAELTPADAAAMTVVCNVLLNLDEMLLKR